MTALDAFLARCDALAEHRKIAPATLSTRLFNDGKKIRELEAGKDIGVRRLQRAERDLDRLIREFDAGRPA